MFGVKPNALSTRHARLLLIAAMGLFVLLHLRVFSLDLIGFHVWRQTQTQTVIDNFYEEDVNILHPRVNARGDGSGIYRTDFPLMQWIIAAVYRAAGNDIMVTRVMMCLFTLLSMLALYAFLRKRFRNELIATCTAIMYVFTPMMYYYGMVPLVDVFALMLTMMGMYWWYCFVENSTGFRYFILANLVFVLASMIKTPFILFLGGLWWYVLIGYLDKSISLKHFLRYISVALVIAIPGFIWIGSVIISMQEINNPVVGGVISAEGLTVGKYLSYIQFYVVSLLPGVLTGYSTCILFVIGLLFVIRRLRNFTPFGKSLLVVCILLCLYVFYEAPAMHTAHDYYFMPFLPLIFMLVAFGFQQWLHSPKTYLRYMAITIVIVSPLIGYTRMDARWNEKKPGFNVDLYTYHEEIKSILPDDALTISGNDESKYIWPYYLDTKGWTFKENKLTDSLLNNYMSRGATWLITDLSEDRLEQVLTTPQLRSAKTFGTIKVIELGL